VKVLLVIVLGAVAVAGFAYLGGFFDHEAEKAGAGMTSLVIGVPGQATAVQVESDLRQASAAAEAYRVEHDGYASMTIDGLRAYDGGLSANLQLARADSAGYCMFETATATQGSATYSVRGGVAAVAVSQGGC
jgi:hypothetical protein